MKNRQKLSLANLKVQSFTTSTDFADVKTVKGGIWSQEITGCAVMCDETNQACTGGSGGGGGGGTTTVIPTIGGICSGYAF